MRGTHRPFEPGQIGLAPDVVMGVDDVGHAAPPPASPQADASVRAAGCSMSSEARRRRARRGQAGCAAMPRGHAAGSADRRRAASARRGGRRGATRRSTALRPWRSGRRARARRKARRPPRRARAPRSAARRERRRSASPMRVPPSQSATSGDAAASACVAVRGGAARRVMRVSRVPKVKISTASAARDQRMGEAQMRLGALLHRAGDVDRGGGCGAAAAGAGGGAGG